MPPLSRAEQGPKTLEVQWFHILLISVTLVYSKRHTETTFLAIYIPTNCGRLIVAALLQR